MDLRFVACVSREVGDLSGDDLTLGRLYEVLGEEGGMLRLIDDSGEDYLYPASCFAAVVVSDSVANRLHDTLFHLTA